MENRQTFVMEYILKDVNNYKNFVVLDAGTGEKLAESPGSQMTLAYYPYDLFNEVYKKFFNQDFNPSDRLRSTNINEYDTSADYVYYYNRRSGANGLYVNNMTLKDQKFDDVSKKYVANVKITYSDRLSSNIGYDNDDAEIIYSIQNGNIIMESFIIK